MDLNEKGLAVNYLYLPEFAEYQPYEPSKAHLSMGPAFMATYVLTQFVTVDEVRKAWAGSVLFLSRNLRWEEHRTHAHDGYRQERKGNCHRIS